MAEDLKMYILIKDTTPPDLVPLVTAHTAVGTLRKFQNDPLMQSWFGSSLFKKVICKVNVAQFEKAKTYGDHFALTEIHQRKLGELGLGFNIQEEYPKFFKFLKLYKV